MSKGKKDSESKLCIDSNDLELLLQKRKSKIGRKRFVGITELISSAALIVSLFFVDFGKNESVSLILRVIFIVIATLLFIFYVIQFIISLKPYTINNLYNEIVELTKEHSFNIVIFQNNKIEGKFLLFKNLRWKCALFPNYKTTAIFNEDIEKTKVIEAFNRDTPMAIRDVSYLGDLKSTKKSIGDKIEKTYLFHFFAVYNSKYSEGDATISSKPFSYNGKEFCWMTLDQMNSNRKIRKCNGDVLNYIREKRSMS